MAGNGAGDLGDERGDDQERDAEGGGTTTISRQGDDPMTQRADELPGPTVPSGEGEADR